MLKARFVLTLNILLFFILSGCAPDVKTGGKRFFFPPPPDVPRIEYIKAYFSDHDLQSTEKSLLTQYVLGENLPEPMFVSPVDAASDGKGKVYVSDTGLRKVLILDMAENELRFLSSAGGGFSAPHGVAVANDGRIFVVDAIQKGVLVFDSAENYLFKIEEESFVRPIDVAVDEVRNRIYVLDTAGHRVLIFDMQGELVGHFGQRGDSPGEFNYPTGVDVDERGFLYVLDALNARVQVFDKDYGFLRMFGERGTAEGSFQVPKDLAVSNLGHVYVTDALAHKVVVFSSEGELLLRIGGKSAVKRGVSPGGFYMPRGVAVDQKNRVWIVDTLNRMVHRFQFLTPEYLSENPVDAGVSQAQ